MGKEIERRFLVGDCSILASLNGSPLLQGYLVKEPGALSTRIRVCREQAWLTLKSPRRGAMRDEYEYPIPVSDAMEILERHCVGRVVRKTRYEVWHAGHLFEVDVFEGRLQGLVIAEVELASVDAPVALPSWIGREITEDRRYGNAALAQYGIPKDPADAQVWRHRESLLVF